MFQTLYVYTDAELAAAVASSVTYREAMRKLGVPTSGGSADRLKKRVESVGIDTSHFRRGDISNIPAGYVGSERHKQTLAAARLAIGYGNCRWCDQRVHRSSLPRHERHCHLSPANLRLCPVCNGPIKGRGETCSKACANTHFRSGPNHPGWKDSSYRSTCFAHHPHACVVCGESLLVEVHHLDENHENNDPENLVPLCATHHQYWHSRHRHLIEGAIMKYVDQFIAQRREAKAVSPTLQEYLEDKFLDGGAMYGAGAGRSILKRTTA